MKRLFPFALALLVGFSLSAGIFNTNLVVNGDAEAGAGSASGNDIEVVPGWTTTGNFTVSLYGNASGIPTNIPGPLNRGTNLFNGGPNTALSSAWQTINLSSASPEIDAGMVVAELTGWLGGWSSQDDNAVLTAKFTDGVSPNVLGTMTVGPVLASDRTNVTALLFRAQTNTLPVGTRQALITLTMTREQGSYDDGSADDISFVLRTPQPSLSVQGGSSVVVSWPASAAGWQLQATASLSNNASWTNVSPPYQTNASQIQWPVPSPGGSQFYRLQLP